ncbi:MAG TPA: amidohydrolase [Acidobacteriota bacterium]|nr:amidohydrolase [Acidobacteriota bacterium]
MASRWRGLLALTLAGLALAAAGDEGASGLQAREPADLVFRGGDVYTVDAARSWVSAVAVAGDRIVYVGSDTGAEAFVGPQTRVVDLDGRMLMPGFQDSHLHPSGQSLDLARLDNLVDSTEVLRTIQEYADANPDRPWILGRGWLEAAFKPSGVPTRQMLDEVVRDRPALMSNASGHQGWANSKALEIAGITADTPDPPNGRIDHDENGEPSGILQEAAQGLVRQHIPPSTHEFRIAARRAALREIARLGITAIIDASSSAASEAEFAELEDAGELTVRAVTCQRYSPQRDDGEQIRDFIARRAALGDGQLRASCVKIGLDGIIEHHTASVLEPFVDRDDGYRGPIFVEPDRLRRVVTRLDAEGFQVQIHAIADRSARESLNAIEQAQRMNGTGGGRHHLAHLQLLDPDDMPRLRTLGVTANMSPLWGRGDDWEVVFAPRVLGPERSQRLLQHSSILGAGANLVWGTDWPVTSLVPVEGIETAVTRRYLGGLDPYGAPDESWLPEERLTLGDAIAAYTISGAYLSFEEDERGSIEVGKLADMVVMDKNLFEVPQLEIHQVAVDMTVFDGRVVFERAMSLKGD